MEELNVFSVPLPYDLTHIHRLAEINKEIKRSSIKYLYGCLPLNAKDRCEFEQSRVFDKRVSSLKTLLPYIEFAKDSGFEFVYLLNSLNVMSYDEFRKKEDKLKRIVETMINKGVLDFRVASVMVIDYLAQNYPMVRIRCSTSQEYSSIKQYDNLFKAYLIKEIVPSWDSNRNFNLLRNLKKLYPHLDIEIMVNEGCISGCPFRVYHSMFKGTKSKWLRNRYNNFFKQECGRLYSDNFALSLCKSNIIYPWQINEYRKIGIKNFKLVGRNSDEFKTGEYLDIYRQYLLGVDDIRNILSIPIVWFNHALFKSPGLQSVKVSDVIEVLPSIRFFSEKRFSCADVCGVECNYCFEKAKQLETILQRRKNG